MFKIKESQEKRKFKRKINIQKKERKKEVEEIKNK